MVLKKIQKVSEILGDVNQPMKARYRALFTLKNIAGLAAIEAIATHFQDDSALLKHEMAYCLGQMQDSRATEILKNVLTDQSQDVIVRHEAAEALGALGNSDLLPILERFAGSKCPTELAETCQIAMARINWLQAQSANDDKPTNPFNSVDPAPPFPVNSSLTTTELQNLLVNEQLSLFERYRALFSLRNQLNEESTLAITKGLKCSSALFRHEIAYVLGQLADPAAESALRESLSDKAEHGMVRHECAEALGAIATDSSKQTLSLFINDPERLVRESCEVALDMSDYATSDEFQYANGLELQG